LVVETIIFATECAEENNFKKFPEVGASVVSSVVVSMDGGFNRERSRQFALANC